MVPIPADPQGVLEDENSVTMLLKASSARMPAEEAFLLSGIRDWELGIGENEPHSLIV
jgi:hypothetical protein